jgi:hypothetical protein
MARSAASSQAGDSSKSNLSVNLPHPTPAQASINRNSNIDADDESDDASINTGSETWDEADRVCDRDRRERICSAIAEEDDEVDSMEFWMDDDSSFSDVEDTVDESNGQSLERSFGLVSAAMEQEVGLHSDVGEEDEEDRDNEHDDDIALDDNCINDANTYAADIGDVNDDDSLSDIDFSDVISDVDYNVAATEDSTLGSVALKPLTRANIKAYLESSQGSLDNPDIRNDEINEEDIDLQDNFVDFDGADDFDSQDD